MVEILFLEADEFLEWTNHVGSPHSIQAEDAKNKIDKFWSHGRCQSVYPVRGSVWQAKTGRVRLLFARVETETTQRAYIIDWFLKSSDREQKKRWKDAEPTANEIRAHFGLS